MGIRGSNLYIRQTDETGEVTCKITFLQRVGFMTFVYRKPGLLDFQRNIPFVFLTLDIQWDSQAQYDDHGAPVISPFESAFIVQSSMAHRSPHSLQDAFQLLPWYHSETYTLFQSIRDTDDIFYDASQGADQHCYDNAFHLSTPQYWRDTQTFPTRHFLRQYQVGVFNSLFHNALLVVVPDDTNTLTGDTHRRIIGQQISRKEQVGPQNQDSVMPVLEDLPEPGKMKDSVTDGDIEYVDELMDMNEIEEVDEDDPRQRQDSGEVGGVTIPADNPDLTGKRTRTNLCAHTHIAKPIEKFGCMFERDIKDSKFPHPESELQIQRPKPVPNKNVQLTMRVFGDHAHCEVARRRITGILDLIISTPFCWFSKMQRRWTLQHMARS
jgi:hypothetical protein